MSNFGKKVQMVSGKLALVKKAILALNNSLKRCVLCPRRCGADRLGGSSGYCRASYNPTVYSYLSHRGEEPPISGTKGSGTIFFSHCNMKCAYCQNYYFSQLDKGEETTIEGLADIMMSLERDGCHNINLVTPTHYIPQILMSLEIALERGLKIPIVYNTSGYELAETIRILEGIVDIYMPDMRYSDNAAALKYSDAEEYVKFNRAAVKEMYRQVGDLEMDEARVAKKGLIIRLLVLPNSISGTNDTLRFIKKELGNKSYLSIMSQYYPTFKACGLADISRGILTEEYKNVIDEAHLLGLNNGWIQEAPEETDPGFLGTNIKPKEGY
ncbi:MAG: radical SAM protein [Candidatus Omnitrophica bacterium]|nr:radical SAM protein [Candidatus Omnitrophota bacterium]MBU1808439.1 radical SAM protein [Candidatus Omnitrophota bacterium]